MAQLAGAAVSLRRASTVLLVLKPERRAELWVDTAAVSLLCTVKRAIKARTAVFEDDVADITGMSFPCVTFGKEDKVVEVMAWGANLVHTKKTKGEDNALLVLKFASGGIGHCELSWTTKGGLDLRNEIHGSEGSLFTDVTRGTPISSFTTRSAGYVIEKADIDHGWTRALPEEAFAYGYQAEMRHFVECARDGRTPRETYEDGYIVNCILDAGYQSMRGKKWIRVKY